MKSAIRLAAAFALGLLLVASAAHSKPKASKSPKAKPGATKAKAAAGTAKAAEVPRLGLYTGIWVGTQSDFGRAEPDLTILPGGRYRQLDKVGRYKYFPAERRIEWLDGPIPTEWAGFFKPAGSEGAKLDTIVIRDKKDVAEGNMRDLRWYNAR